MQQDKLTFKANKQRKRDARRISIGFGLLCTLLNAPVLTAQTVSTVVTDHFVASQPQNLSWGWFPIDKQPVLTIQSGDTVSIDTLTHEGGTQTQEPVEFLSALGVPREEMLQDMLDFWSSKQSRPREGRSGHIITGPIYIQGAEPGDTLEVQILDVQPRVPWGVNNTGPQSGVFSTRYPGYREDDQTLDIPREKHLIRTEPVNGRNVAVLAPNIHVPLAPFMG
ncbi:MAG: acetamidase/formamidase, partial [Pseudohongiellaceae bacterium]